MAKSSALAQLEAVIGAPPTDAVAAIVGPQITNRADALKAIKSVEADIDKQFNTKFSLMRLGDKVGVPVPSISTGLISVDKYVIQCGGIPRGRIVEIYGPESGGKTTFCLQLIAQEQKATGDLCAFIDAEHALDPSWAAKNGVNVDDLIISQPDSGEQALETVIALVRSRAVSMVVVDSVSALVPQAELDGDMGDSHMGLQARMMSQAMRKLRGICAQTGIPVIFINQIREKIGVMFGSPETTSGGRALKFFASLRLDIRKIAAIKEGDTQVGHKLRVKCVKNKVGSPFREAEIDLLYDSGLDMIGDLINVAVSNGIVEKSGSWYNYKTDRLGQGLANVTEMLKSNPEFLEKIKNEVNQKL